MGFLSRARFHSTSLSLRPPSSHLPKTYIMPFSEGLSSFSWWPSVIATPMPISTAFLFIAPPSPKDILLDASFLSPSPPPSPPNKDFSMALPCFSSSPSLVTFAQCTPEESSASSAPYFLAFFPDKVHLFLVQALFSFLNVSKIPVSFFPSASQYSNHRFN